MSVFLHPVTQPAQIAEVAALAREIWHQHYPAIISVAQIDYMLARFQSPDAIAAQLAAGDEYYLIGLPDKVTPHGYVAIRNEPATSRLFVSKLYLRAALRGQGHGRAVLQQLAQLARQRGFDRLWLTVNKHNPALQAYLRVGFTVVADVVTEVGSGYVMDDYQLEWHIAGARPG